ncbi:histidine phosphatase family protein [Orrella sp. JC864]|uniref:histidine phosphatase family protein n=1 Tax=Orrella sp. JC864 TaxID=3120298 RepID=UPI00300AD345
MTEFWFIRHGETDWNVARRMQGWQDIPLNANGVAQARKLALRLRGDAEHSPFSALYSSDLMRAHHTAQAISEQLDLRIRTEPGVRERCFGVLEGVELARMDQAQPEAAAAWKSRDPHRPIEGGETLGQFRARVVDAVDALASRHAHERVLVLTHGGVLDIIWHHAQDLPLNAPRQEPLLNVSINRVVVDAGSWRIANWGDVGHMNVAVEDDFSAP